MGTPPKTDDHVLPRPVTRLPDYAVARARHTAAEKLVERFKLSSEAAECLAKAVVDPAELRQAIEHPVRLAVPGGTLLGVRSELWSRQVMPDPRNPRIGPSRRHPFAVDPGTDEESRFAPVPDPVSQGAVPELHVTIESREHMTWACDQAKQHVLDTNDWRESIRNQGVMTEVWVALTRYEHSVGTPALWAPTTVEGSSRLTAVHDILGIRTVDSIYDTTDRQMRSLIGRLNDAFDRGADRKDREALRCERLPALVLIGFEPHPGGTTEFSTAVKSLVALRHVDAPKEWGEGPENESLADACLEELQRRELIAPEKRRWLAGSMTRAEADAAHFSADPAVRAAAIVEVFASNAPESYDAIRTAVTSQSTRKRVSPLLRIKLATALIVRSLNNKDTNVDQIRRYLQLGFGETVRNGGWSSTTRPADDLFKAALHEHRNDPGPDQSALGPHRIELAVRAAYSLIVSKRLWADRGTANNDQPDRRVPGQVIDRMVRDEAGLRQLHRALVDHASGEPIRAVDETGQILLSGEDDQEVYVSDTYLRQKFPAPGQVLAPPSTKTATEKLQAALAEFSKGIDLLERAKGAIDAVLDTDGTPLVEHTGVATADAANWRGRLTTISDELEYWGRTYKRRHRAVGTVPTHVPEQDVADEVTDAEMDEGIDEQEPIPEDAA